MIQIYNEHGLYQFDYVSDSVDNRYDQFRHSNDDKENTAVVVQWRSNVDLSLHMLLLCRAWAMGEQDVPSWESSSRLVQRVYAGKRANIIRATISRQCKYSSTV